jgi:hypothetical protein
VTRLLEQILNDLDDLDDRDPEVSHERADELLVEAIRRLAPYATETVDEGHAEDIIGSWFRLKKWYA